MTKEERAALLPKLADDYDALSAAFRRLAAGPQLRLVPPSPSSDAGEG